MAGKQPFRANSAYQNQEGVSGLIMDVDRWRLNINEANEEEEEPFDDDEDIGLPVSDEDQEVCMLQQLYADVEKQSSHKLTSVREMIDDTRSEQPMSVQSKATDEREPPACKAFESDTGSAQKTPQAKDQLRSSVKESYLPTA